jgi:hypothetical protein
LKKVHLVNGCINIFNGKNWLIEIDKLRDIPIKDVGKGVIYCRIILCGKFERALLLLIEYIIAHLVLEFC